MKLRHAPDLWWRTSRPRKGTMKNSENELGQMVMLSGTGVIVPAMLLTGLSLSIHPRSRRQEKQPSFPAQTSGVGTKWK